MGRTQSLHAWETTSHPCPFWLFIASTPSPCCLNGIFPQNSSALGFSLPFSQKHFGWVLSLEPMGFILCHLLGMIPEVTDHNSFTSGSVIHIFPDASQSLCSSLLPPPPLILNTPKPFGFTSLLHPYCCGQRLKLSSFFCLLTLSHFLPRVYPASRHKTNIAKRNTTSSLT